MVPPDFDDCFATLGLSPSASWGLVQARYRRLLFAHHPDRNGGDAYARQRFEAVTHAFQTLSEAFSRHGPTHPVGRCDACRDAARLVRSLDGNHYCEPCAVDERGRRGLPMMPLTVASCGGVILGIVGAAALLLLGWRIASVAYVLAALAVSGLSLTWLMVICLTIRYTVSRHERRRMARAWPRS